MFSLKIKIAVKKIEFNPISPCFVRNFLSGGSGPEWQIWEAHGGWIVPFTPRGEQFKLNSNEIRFLGSSSAKTGSLNLR